MSRYLQLLFRRDPSRDRQEDRVFYEGYDVLWPDGQAVSVGVDALCKHGQRLLSLGRHLAGRHERLLDLICFPLTGRDDHMTRLPGHRVRRFYIERHGRQGRLHFFDGTPTAIVLDLSADDPRVLRWVGLTELDDGEQQWFDLAAQPSAEPGLRLPATEAPFRQDSAV
jgi:hypothetical protein